MAADSLAALLAAAEVHGIETGVTLTLADVVVSGVLISHRAYITGFAAHLRTVEGEVSALLAPLADELEALAALLPAPPPTDGAPDAQSYRWVYLKHAVLITSAGMVQVGQWVGETADIVAYRLGERDVRA
jgi:hypothetical protein